MEETVRNLRRRGTLVDLPRDIIEEILFQLSVKDLSRLKCVSKPLRSLISSEGFVRAHLSKSSKDESFARFKIVTNGEREPEHILPYYFASVPQTDVVAARALRHRQRRRFYSEELTNVSDQRKRKSIAVRSSNGLVCDFSVCGEKITLRNPSTKKHKKLPPVDFEKGTIYGAATSCGFGYVESTGDYKVFALSPQRKIDGVYRCTAKVYSLKMDHRWRVVDDNYELKTPMDLTARCLCGILYWLRVFRNSEDRLRWEIISFDLEKEAFGITVEQPGELLEGSLYAPQLGVFRGGSLCVLCVYSIHTAMDLWVLKQQHSPPSWTRVAILPDAYCSLYYFRLALSADGVISRDTDRVGLSYYLPNDMRRRSLRIVDLDVFEGACVHVESLVSLGDSEEDGAIVSGSVVDFEMEKRRFEDLVGDDDDDDNDDDHHLLEVRRRGGKKNEMMMMMMMMMRMRRRKRR